MIHDEKEYQVLKSIEKYFQREGLIKELPKDTDPDDFEKMLTVQ